MPGLVDLAGRHETVEGVRVTGITAAGLASLLGRFPELRKYASGVPVTTDELIGIAPAALAAIIAAGIGAPGDDEQEGAAAALPLSLQADFLEAIIRMTAPGGVGPFVERVLRLMGVPDDADKTQAQT